jgi:hypothetical protein
VDSSPSAAMFGASLTRSFSNGTCTSSPAAEAASIGTNDKLEPKSPVFTATHSGSPLERSR